jgi:hypothetical protein
MNQSLLKAKPLYMQLKDKLEALIDAENLIMLPRERDIEKLFGISRITVRKAVKELTKEGKVIPVQGRGTIVAKHAPATSREIGVIAGSYGWHTENLFAVASEESKSLNFNLNAFVMNLEDPNLSMPSSNTLFSHLIASGKLNGLLLSTKVPEESLKYLIKKKLPMVISGIKYKKFKVPSVRLDFIEPMENMTKTLLGAGLNKIAFIAITDETEEEDNAIGDCYAFHKSYKHIIKKFKLPEYYFPKRGKDKVIDAMIKLYNLPKADRPQVLAIRFFRDRQPALDFLKEKKDWNPLLITSGNMTSDFPRITSERGITIKTSLRLLSEMIDKSTGHVDDILLPAKVIIPEEYLNKHRLTR